MKRSHRIACALLACLMSASLAACGNGTTPPTDASAPPAQTSEGTTTTSGTQATAPADEDGPLTPMKEKVTLTVGVSYGTPESPEVPTGTTPETQSFNKLLLDKLNIELKYLWCVPSEQGQQRFQLAITSGEIPDIMKIDSRQYMEFLEADMLADLRPAYDQYANDMMKEGYEYFNNAPLDMCTKDGKLLSLPYCTDTLQQLNMLFYRADWLKKLGKTEPKTIDELHQLAIAFAKEDPDGNGQADTIGLGLYQDVYAWSLDARGLFQGYGSYPTAWLEKNGALEYGSIQPETKTALDKLRQMYADGAISKEFATLSMDQLVEQVVSSKVGLVYGEWWVPNWPLNNNMEADPTAEWKAMEMPSADGSPAVGIRTRNNINVYNVVSAKAPKDAAVAAVKLLNLYWDIQWNPGAEERYGEIVTPKGGFVYNWVPFYNYYANEQSDNYKLANEVLLSKDTTQLKTQGQIDLYDASTAYLNNAPTEKWPLWKAWGLWYSRVAEDGGWGLTEKIAARGNYIYNEYYGDPTPTQQTKNSTLDDMWKEFVNRYIMGDLPESAWDTYVSDWKSLGGDDITKEVNEQYQAIKAQ